MNGKRNASVMLSIILILSLSLSACGVEVEDLSLDLKCTPQGDCTLSVHNLYHNSIDYTVDVDIETQGVPIGEWQMYANTDAARHEYWYYQYRNIFNHSDTLAENEIESYVVENIVGSGQTLVKMKVTIDESEFTDDVIITKYQVITFPDNTETTPPVINTLSCADNRIIARTSLTEGTSDQTMGIYYNGNIEKTDTYFVVKEGAYAEINIPMPEGTSFVELDIAGHRSGSFNEDLKESHKYRAYCIPPAQ
jgi:hypothetical protein